MKTRLQLQNLTARRIPPANTSVSTGAASSLLCSFAHSQVLPRYYSARPQLSTGAIPRRGTGRCSCVGRPAAESLLHTQGARSQYHCRQISGEGRRTPQDDKTWDCYPGPTATRVPLPPRPHTAPTAHLLERLHQFLFIVIIRDALDSGEGLPAVPLLDPYMDVVLSAGRKQVITLTCISKGVCGERPSAPAPPRRAPIGPPARPSPSSPAPSPPPRPPPRLTQRGPGAQLRHGAGPPQGGAAGPGPAPRRTKASPKGWRFWIADIRYASLPSARRRRRAAAAAAARRVVAAARAAETEDALAAAAADAVTGAGPAPPAYIPSPCDVSTHGKRARRLAAPRGRHDVRPNAATPRLARRESYACAVRGRAGGGGCGGTRGGACAVRWRLAGRGGVPLCCGRAAPGGPNGSARRGAVLPCAGPSRRVPSAPRDGRSPPGPLPAPRGPHVGV